MVTSQVEVSSVALKSNPYLFIKSQFLKILEEAKFVADNILLFFFYYYYLSRKISLDNLFSVINNDYFKSVVYCSCDGPFKGLCFEEMGSFFL